jgi:hypothetical protein
MTTASLNARSLAGTFAAIVIAAIIGGAAVHAFPAVASAMFASPPHPVLAGTPAEAAGIAWTNLAPLLALVFAARASWAGSAFWRLPGDLVAAVLALGTGLHVGAALALYGTSLLPFLPHLPLELAGLTLACSTWHLGRSSQQPITAAFCAVVVLVLVAAVVEVYATPHRARASARPVAVERCDGPQTVAARCNSAHLAAAARAWPRGRFSHPRWGARSTALTAPHRAEPPHRRSP